MKLLLLLPIILVLIFASTSIVFAQTSGMTIMATADKGSDTITVTGKTVSDTGDITFRVTTPNGDKVVAISQVSPNEHGKFTTIFTVNKVWSDNGFYKIEAAQGLVQNSLYPLHVLVKVDDHKTEKTFVTDSNFDINLEVPPGASIVVQTDKSSYSKGERIDITGKVSYLDSGIPVSITMTDPNGKLVTTGKVSVNADKTFEASYGDTRYIPLMKVVGDYTITVEYGMASRSAETTFYFDGYTTIPDPRPLGPKPTCGIGTEFYDPSKPCVLNGYQGNTTIPDPRPLGPLTCDRGTVFDDASNSCESILYQKNTGSENSRLKAEIRVLQEQNNILHSEIRDLRNIIYNQIGTILKILQSLN